MTGLNSSLLLFVTLSLSLSLFIVLLRSSFFLMQHRDITRLVEQLTSFKDALIDQPDFGSENARLQALINDLTHKLVQFSRHFHAHDTKKRTSHQRTYSPIFPDQDEPNDPLANSLLSTTALRSALSPSVRRDPQPDQAIARLHAIHKAASKGNKSRCLALIQQGANVNERDPDNKTPLMYASIGSHVNHVDCARALIKQGADLEARDCEKATALHWAASQGTDSMLQLLISSGAEMLKDNESRLPLHWVTQNNASCLKVILKAVTDINAADKSGMTALMWAAFHKRADNMAILLKHHADPSLQDMDDRSVQHWAIHDNNISCLKLVIHPDTELLRDAKGKTALHVAAEQGDVKSCQYILQQKNSDFDPVVNDVDNCARTPLHYAAACNHSAVIRILLRFKCSLDVKDAYNMTALDYARAKNYHYCVLTLTTDSAVALHTGNRRGSRKSLSPATLPQESTTNSVPLSVQLYNTTPATARENVYSPLTAASTGASPPSLAISTRNITHVTEPIYQELTPPAHTRPLTPPSYPTTEVSSFRHNGWTENDDEQHHQRQHQRPKRNPRPHSHCAPIHSAYSTKPQGNSQSTPPAGKGFSPHPPSAGRPSSVRSPQLSDSSEESEQEQEKDENENSREQRQGKVLFRKTRMESGRSLGGKNPFVSGPRASSRLEAKASKKVESPTFHRPFKPQNNKQTESTA
eukprot:m.46320 g.46320  ORF g.46320 m.46320 type:complete len:697 (-) comp17512_c0_seq1:143-2233(-)